MSVEGAAGLRTTEVFVVRPGTGFFRSVTAILSDFDWLPSVAIEDARLDLSKPQQTDPPPLVLDLRDLAAFLERPRRLAAIEQRPRVEAERLEVAPQLSGSPYRLTHGMGHTAIIAPRTGRDITSTRTGFDMPCRPIPRRPRR